MLLIFANGYASSKGGLENDILYYILVDRFQDGDSGNNIPEYAFDNKSEKLADQLKNKIKYTDAYFQKYNSHLKSKNKSDPRQMVQETVLYNQINNALIKSEYDPSKRYMGQYFGGDLEGIIQRLPYLADLGVTQLVLTPIMDNANGWIFHPKSNYTLHTKPNEDLSIVNKKQAHMITSYHGYWTIDWFEIDEHWRSSKDSYENRFDVLKRLLVEANKYDIGIILDITLNHTSPLPYDLVTKQLIRGSHTNPDSDTFPETGAIYQHGIKLARGIDQSTHQYDPDAWFNPPMDIDFSKNPPKLFEELSRMSGGIPDLNQNYEHVKRYLLDAVEFWLRFNTDNQSVKDNVPIRGFRLDAIKHVNNHFWKSLEQRVDYVWNDLLTKIPNLPKKAILIGEYFDGGLREKDSLDYISQMQNSSMFDFGLSIPLRQFFSNERNWYGTTQTLEEQTMGINHPKVIKKLDQFDLSKQINSIFFTNPLEIPLPHFQYENISYEDQKSWITFLESHDMPRLKTAYPHNNGKDMPDTLYGSAVRFLLTARGVPLLMYGMETSLALPYHPELNGLFGIGGDPFNRPMMIWPGDPGWNQEIYEITKEMIHLRKNYPLLRYGETRFLKPQGHQKGEDIFMLRYSDQYPYSILYAYSSQGGQYLINLAKNNIEFSGEFEFSRNAFKDEFPSDKVQITFSSEDTLGLDLGEHQSVVIVIKKRPGDNLPQAF